MYFKEEFELSSDIGGSPLSSDIWITYDNGDVGVMYFVRNKELIHYREPWDYDKPVNPYLISPEKLFEIQKGEADKKVQQALDEHGICAEDIEYDVSIVSEFGWVELSDDYIRKIIHTS